LLALKSEENAAYFSGGVFLRTRSRRVLIKLLCAVTFVMTPLFL